MNSNDATQTDNTVTGDLVGRDKNSTTNINVTYSKSAYLKELYDKFNTEEKNNVGFRLFIEELDYYNSQTENDTVLGLENKLISGNRQNIIWYAKETKERFHKKLLQTSQFSEVGQKINIYLLATVRSYYMLEIYPLICSNEPQMVVNTLIREKLINPLMTELGENLFGFTPDDIMGMLYFLTGNCHIKWTI